MISSTDTQKLRDCLSAYDVCVVGAGLAGSEAALSLSKLGYRVALFEMRPKKLSPAHHTGLPAELVCSNSFKSKDLTSASGLLKKELEILGSTLIELAYEQSVPAGGALAVDREAFSCAVAQLIDGSSNITLFEEEFVELDVAIEVLPVLIAAGPLASDELTERIQKYVGEGLSFMDAAAPIVMRDSLDERRIFPANRYGKGDSDDYLNAAFTREEYEHFYTELISAARVVSKDFESKDLFQACQPVEEIARKGFDALRFGALKPVGITDPSMDARPFAVVQLRAETKSKTAYNLVGFQTNLTWPEQRRVFSLIPGFEKAEFVRLGVMHRNTFIDAPRQLKVNQQHQNEQNLFFAGQITGTEGYTEAIASGLMAALQIDRFLKGSEPIVLPKTGALGSLYAYAFNEGTSDYQPMHVNFGIVDPLENRIKNKRLRYLEYARRGLSDLESYLEDEPLSLVSSNVNALFLSSFQFLDEKQNEIHMNSKKERNRRNG